VAFLFESDTVDQSGYDALMKAIGRESIDAPNPSGHIVHLAKIILPLPRADPGTPRSGAAAGAGADAVGARSATRAGHLGRRAGRVLSSGPSRRPWAGR